MTGTLVLVATPIGNLGDLSPRAVATMQQASLILCEDTRHSGKLLSHAGISGVRLAVCNEHTEIERAREVLSLLDTDSTVALITDAGTPGISDPGSRLVRAVLDAGHAVSAVPGPAAFLMALVVSGFDTSRFVFEGFLPRSGLLFPGSTAFCSCEPNCVATTAPTAATAIKPATRAIALFMAEAIPA
ncbi:MAG: 16S rRNA (cytidine(1402)-2'-O)-methyltransferase [Ilumatobacteraceae bacterium]